MLHTRVTGISCYAPRSPGAIATFALGLAKRLLHMPGDSGEPPLYTHRDWAHPPAHICTGTGLTPATSAPGLGSPCHICAETGLTPLHLHRDSGKPPLYIHRDEPHLLAHLHWARLDSLVSHLHRDWANPSHSHPHRDWANPSHSHPHQDWANPSHSHPHQDWANPCPHSHQDWANPCPHLHRDWAHPFYICSRTAARQSVAPCEQRTDDAE
jgi:hypothetical protein